MKTSLIVEKKKITIGELIEKYDVYFNWFIMLGVNLLIIYCFDFMIKNLIESEQSDIDNDIKIFLSEKIHASKIIICIECMINLFCMLTHSYITYYIESRIMFLISISLYLLSIFFYKPTFLHLIIINKIKHINYNNYSIFMLIISYYAIVEWISIIIFLILFVVLFILLMSQCFDYFIKIYKLYIENISFEYTETYYTEVEKIV